ncbi:MAG: manganese efflux pump [Oscillospiraceae bacterium]|nr:manganese efflux pump [Oscillospiraceae bacterium]
MELGAAFFINSILLGIGLAMDAFSVSLANGLNNPAITFRKALLISGVFSLFQAIMPLAGYFLVHSFISIFRSFEKLVPCIALLLLWYIGIRMLLGGMHTDSDKSTSKSLTLAALTTQGIATSIDALSVGFTISEYDSSAAICCALLIAAITFPICTIGVMVGKKIGNRYTSKAAILGAGILIFIGAEIFLSSFF